MLRDGIVKVDQNSIAVQIDWHAQWKETILPEFISVWSLGAKKQTDERAQQSAWWLWIKIGKIDERMLINWKIIQPKFNQLPRTDERINRGRLDLQVEDDRVDGRRAKTGKVSRRNAKKKV